jgi:hypothetical protein
MVALSPTPLWPGPFRRDRNIAPDFLAAAFYQREPDCWGEYLVHREGYVQAAIDNEST